MHSNRVHLVICLAIWLNALITNDSRIGYAYCLVNVARVTRILFKNQRARERLSRPSQPRK